MVLPSSTVISENSAKGLSIHQVNITDMDTADTHTFTSSYSPIEGAKYFDVDTITGLVSTSTQNIINYESLNATDFQITIYVSDGIDITSETLNITVENENEAPYFDKSIYAISEDEDLSQEVETDPGFVVTDPDTTSTLAYTMDCGAYQVYFSINETSGNVTLGTGYDLDNGTNPSTVSCTVVVTDGELNDTATLLITMNQINDNTPQFNSPTYTFNVSSDYGIGTLFGSISASDGDNSTHIFGTVSYSLNLSSACDCFAVSNTGELYVKQSLTSYTSGTTFTFTAKATDGGNLQNNTTITIIINPQTATTTTTTTTDRYITFLEDPRNAVWLVLVGCALLGFLVLMVYFTYTLGWLDGFCIDCTTRL
ncbi:hypothetical protein KUTeg_005582 [Tegillarca granosa]|uniref:Cadherin domain-containing protein n=1 Tax=Tegillarca granosa TaxID=220873 RepID=A0ABQ9FK37_TEGGR|nr:hypothetical protein KUTeg_005582 [Tegillarca granosa]